MLEVIFVESPTRLVKMILLVLALLRCPAVFFRVHDVRSGGREEEVEGGGAYLADSLHTCLYLVSALAVHVALRERLFRDPLCACPGGAQQQPRPPQRRGRRLSVDAPVFSRS